MPTTHKSLAHARFRPLTLFCARETHTMASDAPLPEGMSLDTSSGVSADPRTPVCLTFPTGSAYPSLTHLALLAS